MPRDAKPPSRNARFWLVAPACSVNLVFGTFLLANSLGIQYYHFYAREVVNIVIFSPYVDWLIWLASAILVALEMLARVLQGRKEGTVPLWTAVPCVLLMASFPLYLFSAQAGAIASALLGYAVVALSIHYGKGLLFASRGDALALVLAGSGAILVAIELASLGSWLVNPFDYQFPFDNTPRWAFPRADLGIFSLLYPLVPLLLLLFLFCWVWMPLGKRLLPRLGRLRAALATGVHAPRAVSRRLQAAVLLITASVGGFVAYYPYIRLSAEYLLGRDGVRYYDFLSRLVAEGPFAAIAPDRPLFMVLLYYLKAATLQPAETVVRFMPVVCAVFLVLATFWLVKTGTRDARLALLSSILAAFSFQVTAGMMGYFLAGWFAMAEIMVFFTLLLKAMESRPLVYSLLAGLVSIAILGTHPYHWLMMAAVLVLYTVLTAIARRGINRQLLVPAVPLAVTALAAVPLILFTSLGANGVPTVIAVVNSLWQTLVASFNLSKLTFLLPSLSRMADFWVGGAFGSPLIYVLGIIGMATLTDLKKDFNRLLLCWVLVPSLAILALVPGMEPYHYRIAYFIPFQIPAAVGFSWLLLRLHKALGSDEAKPAKITCFRLLEIALLSLLLLILFNYALRIVEQAVVLSI